MDSCHVTDRMLTPAEVRNMERRAIWPYEHLARLCRDYLTLWDRNKELEDMLSDTLEAMMP